MQNKLKNLTKKSLKFVVLLYSKVRLLHTSYIRIEEINTNTQEIVVHSPGLRTVLKLSIAEAIADPNILCQMQSLQACWLGYYSSMSAEEGRGLLQNDKGLLLRFRAGQCKIVSLDRKGLLTFLDTVNGKPYTDKPLRIARDSDLVSKFDPSQACYIGILAGIDRNKAKNSTESSHQKPYLRVVN